MQAVKDFINGLGEFMEYYKELTFEQWQKYINDIATDSTALCKKVCVRWCSW